MKAKAENWRASRAVLVPEASAIGMIAVIRSLGRAGYPVHAVSNGSEALGFRSVYAAQSAVHPGYDDPRFLPWLEEYVATNAISAIVPSEGFLLAVRPVFATYAPLMPISNDERTVYRAMSKCDVLAAFRDGPPDANLLDNLPPTITIMDTDPVPCRDALDRLDLPIFVKADGAYARETCDSVVVRAATVDDALEAIARLRESHSAVLIQSFVPGTRVVADFCIWNDEIISESMMTARHENPHYGGISTLRSIAWDQAIWDDAVKKLRRLDWNGCAMMEYRRDPATGAFYFIEINARYWTGLHVELFAGIDIPCIQMDAFFGRTPPAFPRYVKPSWCRYTVPGETGYVTSILKDNTVPIWRKAWAILEFFMLTMHPGIKSDLNFPGDRKLYFLAWHKFLRQIFLTEKMVR
ncbi:MAG: hypothetical protein O7H40_04065 [Gammaproteobacteria bacterium]|nr:hypothetical protein [Gammaproteobacteria bacterium]